MNFNKYQAAAIKTAIYPEYTKIVYPALLLAEEVGETLQYISKNLRDGREIGIKEISYELGDVLWALANLANDLGIKFQDIADLNIDKLVDRKLRGKLSGSGDNR